MHKNFEVKLDTFVAEKEIAENMFWGKVDVEIDGVTHTLFASRTREYLRAAGIKGLHNTGKRWWAGDIYVYDDGREVVRLGNFYKHDRVEVRVA